jgi:hypothetical protein
LKAIPCRGISRPKPRLIKTDQDAGIDSAAPVDPDATAKSADEPTKPADPKEKRAAKQQEVAKAADVLKGELVGIVLFDLMQPNGTLLRHCTFRECGKLKGWYAKLEGKGKPNEIVGDVLSEEQLQKIKAQTIDA